MKFEPIIPEEINLLQIDVAHKFINDDSFEREAEFDFGAAYKIQHNLKANRLKLTLFIHFTQNDSPMEVKYDVEFYFAINNLDKYYRMEDESNTPVFSAQMIMTLLGMSYSTVRGIIYSDMADTKLKGWMIMPVIDITKLLQSRVK